MDIIRVNRTDETGQYRAIAARPDASFVAQLIATAQRAPQTRTVRRTDPGTAAAVYGQRPSPHASTAQSLTI